jgi:hypothetical protein
MQSDGFKYGWTVKVTPHFIQCQDFTLQPNAVIEHIQAVLVSHLTHNSIFTEVFRDIRLYLQVLGQYLIGSQFFTYTF